MADSIFQAKVSTEDRAHSKQISDEVNQKLKSKGKSTGEAMGKDHFLKLLVTELRHQDPTQPMADKEFIAQMAQFSSLEQMNNMAGDMKSLNSKARNTEAYDLIGKQVQAFDPASGRAVEGIVTHVVRNADEVSLVVNNTEIKVEDVHAVFAPRATAVSTQNNSVQDNMLNPDAQNIDTVNRARAARAYSAQESAVPKK